MTIEQTVERILGFLRRETHNQPLRDFDLDLDHLDLFSPYLFVRSLYRQPSSPPATTLFSTLRFSRNRHFRQQHFHHLRGTASLLRTALLADGGRL